MKAKREKQPNTLYSRNRPAAAIRTTAPIWEPLEPPKDSPPTVEESLLTLRAVAPEPSYDGATEGIRKHAHG